MENNQNEAFGNPTFSRRYGYEPLPQPMRLEEIPDDLRREIWNEVRTLLSELIGCSDFGSFFTEEGRRFVEASLGQFFRKPEDEISTDVGRTKEEFKRLITGTKFNKLLDILEFMINEKQDNETVRFTRQKSQFAKRIKELFKQHATAYWLDTSGSRARFVPRSSKEQGEAVQHAIGVIREAGMEGALTHLRDAAEHMNSQQYGDSIADSIHAVESVACMIASGKSNTLGSALDSLQKSGLLKHKVLKDAFSKLYGYASDEKGIRHALLDRDAPDVGLDEAIFMYGACASFAAYLVSKHSQIEQQETSD